MLLYPAVHCDLYITSRLPRPTCGPDPPFVGGPRSVYHPVIRTTSTYHSRPVVGGGGVSGCIDTRAKKPVGAGTLGVPLPCKGSAGSQQGRSRPAGLRHKGHGYSGVVAMGAEGQGIGMQH